MRIVKATGLNASVIKYDLLTALGAHACAGDKHLQRLALRFMTVIVARYNWQADELTVGQTEMAALWSVDERTVKRVVAQLREKGWLVLRRPAVRGRVATHGLGIERILASTTAAWDNVGPDFKHRMSSAPPTVDNPQSAPATTNVVPFPGAERDDGGALWPRLQTMLHAENPALFRAWFAPLMMLEAAGQGPLTLVAPTRFHANFVATHHLDRLTALARSIAPQVTAIEVTVTR